MKLLLFILLISPVFVIAQVPDTCFTQQEIDDISYMLDSLYIADSLNNNLLDKQEKLINYQTRLIKLDSVQLEYKSKQIELLNENINIYVEREKSFRPKWYDNKSIYFTGGIITAILTGKLITEIVK
jgi:hypothetical protein